MNGHPLACLAIAALGLAGTLAGGDAAFAQAPGPSVDEIVRALQPQPAATRGMGRNLKVERAQIDLTVEFDFDSARLRSESLPVLERLGAAMKSDALGKLRFRIEGHTDGAGSADYNLKLSNRRAQAVGDFLGAQGVPRARLESVGKGASEPLIAADPLAPANRRVRVVTID